MTEYRDLTTVGFRFKPEAKSSEPFPPVYYENEKRAKELYDQMHNPKMLPKRGG